jgi:hypothetical protein
MKFFEVAAQQRNVIATKRFRQDITRYCRGYPGTDEALIDFIQERRQLNSRPWGAKDSPFAGGDKNVRGLWHVHLQHGKVIVIYDVTATDLRLIAVVEHSETDTPRAIQQLGKYYQSLTPEDFQPFQAAPSAPTAPQISAEEKAEISNLMYELASGSDEDRAVLTQLVSGNSAEFLQWAQMTVQGAMSPAQKDQAVMDAFGGQPGLATSAARVLKQMGLSESREPLAERAGFLPVKNPGRRQLNSLSMDAGGGLRGYLDPSGAYVWDANHATHHDAAKSLGLDYNFENRFYLSQGRQNGEIRLDIGPEWAYAPEKALANPHLVRLLSNPQIIIDNGSQGIITGPEFLNELRAAAAEHTVAA